MKTVILLPIKGIADARLDVPAGIGKPADHMLPDESRRSGDENRPRHFYPQGSHVSSTNALPVAGVNRRPNQTGAKQALLAWHYKSRHRDARLGGTIKYPPFGLFCWESSPSPQQGNSSLTQLMEEKMISSKFDTQLAETVVGSRMKLEVAARLTTSYGCSKTMGNICEPLDVRK
ncbi:hypothetical protein [Brucella sp. IR073]|uniref:hypothetical protein n=1 Tax=Brucella sp. IR073 TaxID=3121517 RepID=UPI003B984246